MDKSSKYLWGFLKPYLGKGFVFAPDTNVFMNAPDVIMELRKQGESVTVCNQSFQELDKNKKSNDESSEEHKIRAKRCRDALSIIDKYSVNKSLYHPDHTYIKSKGLSVGKEFPDDKIIAEYMMLQEKENKQCVFITLDRGPRTTARSCKMICSEHDIDTFFRYFNENAHKGVKKHTKRKHRSSNLLVLVAIIICFLIFSHLGKGIKENAYTIKKVIIPSNAISVSNMKITKEHQSYNVKFVVKNNTNLHISFPENAWKSKKPPKYMKDRYEQMIYQQNRQMERFKILYKNGKVKYTYGYMEDGDLLNPKDIRDASVTVDGAIKDVQYIETSFIERENNKQIKFKLIPTAK
ncbi:PIN domain-containing protein [Bacillus sp. FJAT-49736]|uniref:PIN domain-containing protein n=1 Tax=Bacillus sp. FJAT-49736 TaxID=2833582 RepID=UPI001BCA27E0|nr:PIN domain-containing protein [Bacillus sp. FJAT-49736]MBS4174307.1 hypothetical protein [Bacillus sp. FJAT-49736]